MADPKPEDDGIRFPPATPLDLGLQREKDVRYEDGDVVTSNQAENFFSQLKRSLDGTHHHVSRKHLHRYLGEFDFRYSTRDDSDTDRMLAIIDQAAGRRLTYRPLVSAA